MADVAKTCANCGNVQTAGEFCEKCGTRMPATAAPATPPPPAAVPGGAAGAATAGAAAAGAAAAAHAVPQYGAVPSGQSAPQYSAPPQAPPQYGAGGGYGAPPPSYGGPRYDGSSSKGFFGRLFDFSFREFITPSIIKVLFIVSLVVIGLGVLAGIVFGFMVSASTGVMFLIGGLIYGFLMLLYVRVLLELFIVFFRIHDNTNEMARNKR